MAEIIEQWQTRQPGLIITGNEIEDKIREFEAQYGLSSDELLRLVERGEAPEGTDIMEWRILLDLR